MYSIRDLSFSVGERDGASNVSDGVAIYGTPFHKSREELRSEYRAKELHEFTTTEALESCGNYVFLDSQEDGSHRLITSPGYAGGYYCCGGETTYVATELGDLLGIVPNEEISLHPEWTLYFIKHGIQSLPPRITPFEGIYRLPPGSVVEMNADQVTRSDYLFDEDVLRNAPRDLETALYRTVSHLKNRDVTVMFSGGRDSLALYLALQHVQTTGSITPVTIDWQPGSMAQGPYQAKPVARSLDVDLETISFSDGWITRSEPVFSHIVNCLSRDLVQPAAPHYALGAGDAPDHSLVVHGQNMDALVGLDMNRPQESFVEFLRGRNINGRVFGPGYYFLNYFVDNIQYTDLYVENPTARKLFLSIVPPLYSKIEGLFPDQLNSDFAEKTVRTDPQYHRLLENIIRKQTLNTGPDEWSDLFRPEIERERQYINTQSYNHEVKYMKYQSYSHGSNKLTGGVPAWESGPCCSLVPMWGPLSSYFNARSLGLRDAVHPKREVDDYIEKISGESYSSLRFSSDDAERQKDRMRTDEYRNQDTSVLLNKYEDMFKFDTTTISEFARQSGIYDDLSKSFTDVHSFVVNNDSGFSRVQTGHRLLNLELLVSEPLE